MFSIFPPAVSLKMTSISCQLFLSADLSYEVDFEIGANFWKLERLKAPAETFLLSKVIKTIAPIVIHATSEAQILIVLFLLIFR